MWYVMNYWYIIDVRYELCSGGDGTYNATVDQELLCTNTDGWSSVVEAYAAILEHIEQSN